MDLAVALKSSENGDEEDGEDDDHAYHHHGRDPVLLHVMYLSHDLSSGEGPSVLETRNGVIAR